jgi:hypothetical protein
MYLYQEQQGMEKTVEAATLYNSLPCHARSLSTFGQFNYFLSLPVIFLKIALAIHVNSYLFCCFRTKLLMPPVPLYCFQCAIYLYDVLVFEPLFMHVFYSCYVTVYAYDSCMYVCITIYAALLFMLFIYV